jgi:hypothetical protein
MGNLGVNISLLVLASICSLLCLSACFKAISFSSGALKMDLSSLEKKQMTVCLIDCTLMLFFASAFRDTFGLGIDPLVSLCVLNFMGFANTMGLFNPLFSAIEVARSEHTEDPLCKFLNRHWMLISTLEKLRPAILVCIVTGVTLLEIFLDHLRYHIIWSGIVAIVASVSSRAMKGLLQKVDESIERTNMELKSSGENNPGAQIRLFKSRDVKQRLTQATGTMRFAVLLQIIICIIAGLCNVGPVIGFSESGASSTVLPELIAYFALVPLLSMSLVLWKTQWVQKAKLDAVQSRNSPPVSNGSNNGKAGSNESKPTAPELGPRGPSLATSPSGTSVVSEV